MNIRIGIGYDVHALEEGREFWLGGIKINHYKGASGHSDADVIIHAICDALLGALSLGDIGKYFPDTDPQYKNIDSKKLLVQVVEMITSRGYNVGNVDVSLCLEKPKVGPYLPGMIKTLCAILKIRETDVSIKATTSEGLGFVGREEGVEAHAVVLISKN
jgi:2-C-methyl-D-erythritol 2,4-cyclodiphosphate synthase